MKVLRTFFTRFRYANEGFTLLEAVVAVGLLMLAISASYLIILGTEEAQGRLMQRTALNEILDNLAVDLRAGTVYADATNAAVISGAAGHTFTYDGGSQLGTLQCALNNLGTAGTFITVNCQTQTGIAAQRIVRIPDGIPVPGSVVTAPPAG